MKIAIIGGGSTYTPELMEGIIQRHKTIGIDRVALMDVEAERLRVVGEFARRMVTHAGAPLTIDVTTDRREAIRDCSFVLTQIRVGQMPARHKDELLGLRHGLIGQETTGVGGFAKALRTIPVITGVARDIQELAPDAWLINFTNPSGLVTEALHRFGMKRCIGLCNIPIGMIMDLAGYLKVDPKRIRLDYVGLNHLSWVRHVWLDGNDITGDVINAIVEMGPANFEDIDYDPTFLKALGFLPGPYLRYFYKTSEMLEKLKAKEKTRAQEVMEVEQALLAKYADPAVVTKPAELEKRGGAFYSLVALDLVDSIANDKGDLNIVNIPNAGAIDGIGPDQTVEIPAVITRNGAVPLHVGAVETRILGLMQQVKAYETLTVEAALKGSYETALMSLAANPLCPAEKARAVLDDILETHNLSLEPIR